MEINKNFWREKKVFLTGHTGFKGAWLAKWLRLLGSDVTGFALPPSTDPSLFEVLNLESDMRSVFGDIRDLDLLKSHIRKSDPDLIIHMAAQAIVRESYQNPVETFHVNALGTVHLLESLRYTNNTKSVICVTSDKCYENREWLWKYRENDPMGGWDPYSASKGCSELIISSYRSSFFNKEDYHKHGIAVASVRAGNVIGGGDWGQDRLIPDIMRAFSNQEDVVIRNPSAIRPWQYVLDLLSGYLMLAERLYEDGPHHMEAWNFGPNDSDEKTVGEIVKLISTLWGNGANWRLDPDAAMQPHEAFTLKLDSSKARNRLRWLPKLTIDDSLTYIVDWYKQYYSDRPSINSLTEKYIASYENLFPDNKNVSRIKS
jgi:CDP-glucose 4,6-dehydratase